MNKIYLLFLALCLFATTASAQLDNITGVTLAFTPTAGGATVEGTATDSGSGLAVDGPITLMESIDYNVVVTVRSGMNDITNQVQAAANDHQVFFQPMASFFNGDVDATDSDGNGLPVGLLNEVTTECTEDGDFSGMLRVKLADLDGMKSASSSIDDGTALFDLTWTITIEDDTTAPPCENEEEVITDVTLTFTPIDGGTPVVATAQDPDGEGPLNLTVQGDIELLESTEYRMTVELFNSINMEDITEEIRDEDDEHQFFFEFTDEIFLSPAGDGNVDNRDDPINYVDFDENMLPVGLTTDWTTECDEETSTGSFRVILKHQPGVKDGESTVNDGGTDIDITWTVNVNEDPDAPPCENEEEIITDVTLTFTPIDGGTPVVATAQDPDGEGPLDLTVQGDIELLESTEYRMTVELFNSINMEDITEEIREEDDEHQFFFEFTDEIFLSPAGDGNVDNRDDPINYVDFDENMLPVGLTTDWTTECDEETSTGSFRVILKHQPGVKDGESTVNDGGTDIDITWTVNVNEDPDAPPCENEEEIITDVTLTFTPNDGGAPVVASAQDPDGEGPLDLTIMNSIDLLDEVTYTLTIELFNSIEMEDITEEIREEDDEHQFFFEFTEGIFSDPTGDGNADNRDDPINYVDFDENSLPVGLTTTWTAAEVVTTGDFRIVLKHQPGVKDGESTINDGGTDIDLTFDVNVLTSIEELEAQLAQQLVLVPNPATNQLNWRIDGQAISVNDPVDIRIISVTGQVINTYSSPGSRLDISRLPVGSYIFQLQTGQARVNKRFIKID